MGGAAVSIDWPEGGATRAPYAVFSDPEVYAAEMDRVFRGPVWHYLGLEAEIPEPGDYRLIEVGETPVVLLRGSGGELRALVNRCAHKGTMLLYEPFGRVSELMCVYHNWTYGLDGRLRSIPFAKGVGGKGGMPAGFRMAEHGLDRLRVESLGGIVFGTFDRAAPPLADYIGPRLMANWRRMTARPFRVLGYYSQYLASNWKLYVENASDPYHATILHAWATRLKLNRFTMEGAIEMSERGWHHLSWSKMATDQGGEVYETETFRSGREGFDSFGLNDPSVIAQWDEFGDGVTTAIQTVFPNFVLQQIHNTIATRYLAPRGPEGSELFWTVLGYADDDAERTAIRLKQGNLIGPAGYISLEDGMVGGLVQRGVRGGKDKASVMVMGGDAVETIENSRASETGVRGFWTAWRDLMGVR